MPKGVCGKCEACGGAGYIQVEGDFVECSACWGTGSDQAKKLPAGDTASAQCRAGGGE